MKIKLVVVGKIKENYYRNLIDEYIKSIKKYYVIEVCEVKDEPIPQNASDAEGRKVREEEAKKIMANISNDDYVVALCIEGKTTNQNQLADLLKRQKEAYRDTVVFIIGGSLGLDDAVVARANYKMSFSKMTFPHQLMRVMLLEQLFMVSDII